MAIVNTVGPVSLYKRNPEVPPARIEHYGKRRPSAVANARLAVLIAAPPVTISWAALPDNPEPRYEDFLAVDSPAADANADVAS